MNRLASVWPYLAIFTVATLIGVMFLRPDEAPERAPGWNVCSDQGLYWGDELDHRLAVTRISSQARSRVAQELIAGRLTLFEAAERFRELSVADPHYNWAAFRFAYQCPTDEERFCRHVIVVVKSELVDRDPAAAIAVAKRLERELSTRLASGTLRLPEHGGRVAELTGI